MSPRPGRTTAALGLCALWGESSDATEYPIWMLLNLTADYALRLKGREVLPVTKEDGHWDNVRQIPPTAIRALVNHLMYWGVSGLGDTWHGAKFNDEPLEPWEFTNGWCVYDY